MSKIEDFLPKYPNILPFRELLLNPYPEDFYKAIYRKKEFYDKKLSSIEEKPTVKGSPLKHQEIVSRFLSNHTLYNGLLLFHDMGTGKTGASVAVAELIRTQLRELNGTINRTLVLMKGKQLIDNYINELVFTNTRGQYIPEDYDKFISKEVKNRRIKKKVSEFYDFDTFEVFAKDIAKKSSDEIVREYSNRLIVIDEVHNIRFTTEKESKESLNIYNIMHRFLHLIKNSKILLMSATPMRDLPQEIAGILNLILPLDQQLPLGDQFTREFMIRGDREDLYILKESKIPKLKDYFKGRISYLKTQRSNVKKEFVGEKLGQLQKFIVKPIYMNEFQRKNYKIAYTRDTESKEEKGIYSKSSQASLFVFPDGTSGKDGFKNNISVRKLEDRNIYELNVNFKRYLYQNGRNSADILGQVEKCSSKYASAITTILDSVEKGRLSFIYLNFVGGSGAILFSKILELFNFKRFKGDADESEMGEGRRYSIITHQTATRAQTRNILNVFNNPNNINGRQISVIIGSRVIGEGFSLKNIQDIHILTPYWNYSETDQAIARGLRLFSHNDLINAGIVPLVKIYQYVSVSDTRALGPTERSDTLGDSIDYKMYLISEDKDISIKSIERIAKESAFDCALNYMRNRIYDEDNMRSCDYQKCEYQCDGGQQYQELAPEKLDYSTYNLYYGDQEMEDMLLHIRKLFSKKNIYKLQELDNQESALVEQSDTRASGPTEQSDTTNFILMKTLDKIIQERIPILNIHHQLCYLKQYKDTFYLDTTVSADSSATEPYYIENPIFYELKTVDQLVNKYELNRLPSIINTLEKIQDESNFENIFNNLTSALVEFFIEAAVLGDLRKIQKNINLRKWILKRYKTYIIKYGEKYLSTYLYKTSEIKKIRCLPSNSEKWTYCNIPLSDIEKPEEKAKDLGEFGYYGVYSAKDDKFSIVDVSDPTKVAGGAAKGKEKDTRLKSRGRVCKTILKKDLVVMSIRLGIGKGEVYDELKQSEVMIIKDYLKDKMGDDELNKLSRGDLERAYYFNGLKTDELCRIIRKWFEDRQKVEYV